jgi:hypothetical protein
VQGDAELRYSYHLIYGLRVRVEARLPLRVRCLDQQVIESYLQLGLIAQQRGVLECQAELLYVY